MNRAGNTRSILCYGDSNTFGSSTGNDPDGRYAPHERWTGVLRDAMGDGWLVIEEGLGGRTTVSDDPVEGPDKNGRTYLRPCLMSHRPLDLIIIMLGTNDLMSRFNKSSSDIANGISLLVDDINQLKPGRNNSVPKIIIVSPPAILDDETVWDGVFAGGHDKSLHFAADFAGIAQAAGAHFFDAGSVVRSSEVDAIHLDRPSHVILGGALAEFIKSLDWT